MYQLVPNWCGRKPAVRLFILLVANLAVGSAQLRGQEGSSGPAPDFRWDSVTEFKPSDPFRYMTTPVGLLSVEYSDGRLNDVCTGFLISDSYVLTAEHCFEVPDARSLTKKRWITPSKAWLLLDYVQSGVSTRVELDPNPIEKGKSDVEQDPDYMVLKTKSPVSLKGRKIPVVGKSPDKLDVLYIVHTPYPFQLRISRQTCHATDKPIEGNRLEHTCETKPGSSGGPIFDEHFNLVGIHLEGGYDSRIPGTFSTGLLLSEILVTSNLVSQALQTYGSSKPVEASNVQPHKTLKVYKVSDELVFTETTEGWMLQTPNRLSPLSQQKSKPDVWTLWDSDLDVIYEIPKMGGDVSRRIGQESASTVIGAVKP